MNGRCTLYDLTFSETVSPAPHDAMPSPPATALYKGSLIPQPTTGPCPPRYWAYLTDISPTLATE